MTTNLEPVQTFKILIVGDSSVGKSSLMNRFVHGIFHTQYTATIGVDFQIAIVDMGFYKCRLQIWDTAGQERFRSLTSSYYRGADGVIIVYDVTNSASFAEVKSQIFEMERYCDKAIPKILVGNKDDAKNNANKVVSAREASAYAVENSLLFLEISVKENKNVHELFNTMTKLVLQQRLEQSGGVQQNINGTQLSSQTASRASNSKRKCCTN